MIFILLLMLCIPQEPGGSNLPGYSKVNVISKTKAFKLLRCKMDMTAAICRLQHRQWRGQKATATSTATWRTAELDQVEQTETTQGSPGKSPDYQMTRSGRKPGGNISMPYREGGRPLWCLQGREMQHGPRDDLHDGNALGRQCNREGGRNPEKEIYLLVYWERLKSGARNSIGSAT